MQCRKLFNFSAKSDVKNHLLDEAKSTLYPALPLHVHTVNTHFHIWGPGITLGAGV
jgi:hypothetical protein